MTPEIKAALVNALTQADLWQYVFGVLAVVGAPVWAAFKMWAAKKTEALRKKNDLYEEAYKLVEVAVEQVYVETVRALKAKKGKLKKKDILEARDEATKIAINLGKTKGMDILAILGKEYMPVIIAKIVTYAKPSKG